MLLIARVLPGVFIVAALLFAVADVSANQTLKLGDQAQITVPDGFVSLDGPETQAMLRRSGEPVSNREVGMLAPMDEKQSWSLFFEFDPIGYVKDDEQDQLDPDAILASIKQGTEAANKMRVQNNAPEMHITGWHTKPKYNPSTKNLEWCVAASVDGQPLLNYNIRMLGRHGVMEVTLVTDPATLDQNLPQVRSLLNDFSYLPGNNYAEWRAGDKIAEYGLAALIAGGAAAVALKSGLLQKLLKPLIIGVLALGGFLARMFGRRSSE
jgi:uncharacterized membrane-anchored protein